MKTKITNVYELKSEIARLSKLKNEQEAYLNNQYILLKDKIDTPARILSSVSSSIPGIGLVKGLFSMNKKSNGNNATSSDWLNKSVRLALPMLLNTTLFKNAGWLKKTLVLFASQTAANNITEENVTNVVSKMANYIRPKHKAGKHKSAHVKDKHTHVINEDLAEDQILGI